MSDNYRGIDNDGAYKSRHTSSGGSRSGSGTPRNTPPSGSRNGRPYSESSQKSSRSSAVGKYTGDGKSDSMRANSRSGSFHVDISEDDYFDAEAARKEMNAAKRAEIQPQRSKVGSPAQKKKKSADNRNPATAKRVVTGSMGDTYQIEDDSAIAPKQLRSKQKSIRRRNRGCMIALVYSAAVLSISILLSYYLIVGVNDMFALVMHRRDLV